MHAFAIKALLIGLALFLWQSPREAGYKDLSREAPNPIQNHKWNADPTCKAVGGVSGLGIGDPASPSLSLSVADLDTTRLRTGDSVTALLHIENAGKDSLWLPWTVDAELMERPDAKGEFRYSEIGVYAALTQQAHQADFYAPVRLYGAPDVLGSMLELQPGHWAQLRIRFPLECKRSPNHCDHLTSAPALLSFNLNESEDTVTYEKCSIARGSTRLHFASSQTIKVDVEFPDGS
jgi:hypothetical protein